MHPYTLYKRGLMTFWYWYVRKLNTVWPTITLEGKTLKVYPGVYKPIENEQSCVDHCKPGDRVLDLGCGSGVSAVFASTVAREVVAVDISPVAVANAKENCELFDVKNVDVRLSDMFSNVDGKFNVILANPPYIAADFKNDEEQFATSVRYLPVLFSEVGKYMEPDAKLIVQYPGWFKGHIKALAEKHGLKVTSIKRMPLKSLYLSLLSLAYMQVGFRSTLYTIELPKKAEQGKPQNGPAEKTEQKLAA
ncbi:MAG: methyltransferase [Beijerinckiaceae bacterium]